MVGRSPANDSPGQVRRTAAGDREDESTSSTAEESAPTSPSIQNCQQQQRSAPCRLFIASSDQPQQPRCVICGFYELDHLVRVLPRRPPAQPHVTNGNGQKRSPTQRHPSNEQSSSNRTLPRHCDSDWNIFEDDGGGSAAAAWRNSYDVRGEYLSKEDLRAKYGSYFNPVASSSFDTSHPSGKRGAGNNRKFYYHHPSRSGVYYYTDRGRINDSSGDTDVEQKRRKNWPVPTYWSDSEAVKEPNIVAGDPFPSVTFRPASDAKTGQQRHSASLVLPLTNPLSSLLTARKTTSPAMSGQQEPQPPNIPARRSAFVDYKATFNGKNATSENLKRMSKKKFQSAGVSFHWQTAVIGHDGGAEHFLHDDSSDGSSTLDGREAIDDDEEEEAIWTTDSRTEFEKVTEINTEFNADRRNFNSDDSSSKADAAVLVSVTVRPPPVSSPSVSNVSASANGQRVSIDTRGTAALSPAVDGYANHSEKVHVGSNTRDTGLVYAHIQKPASAAATEPTPDLADRKSELAEKLQRMAQDLNACRIGGSATRTKAPAPPPPGIFAASAAPSTGSKVSGVKKSYSSFVVPSSSPSLHASSMDLMTASANVGRPRPRGSGLETVLDRSLSHGRCSSVDVTSPTASDESHSDFAEASGSRQSRSRFASIRKFLRMSESTSSAMVGSVRRSHHESSSTNCSTISCSSSSNGSLSFGHHGGFHSSLRKFPLLPFVMNGSKNRGDLNTVRGLFHGANECRAVDEIAQDTDVIVTEITELPSTNNTLVRASKRICNFGLPSPEIIRDQNGNETNGKPTNGFEQSRSNGTTNRGTCVDEATLDGSPVYINRLEINGHDAQIPAAAASPVSRRPAALPPRPPPATAFTSASHAKVKRTAPGVPASSGESAGHEAVTGKAPYDSDIRRRPESAENSIETAIWRLVATVPVQTTPAPDFEQKTLPPRPASSASTRASLPPAPAEALKRSTFDDRYDQLVAGHLTALSHLVDHFPNTTRQCRRKLINLGVDPAKLKWSDFNVVANTPLLVTETSALYAGVLKLENKPESQSLKVDLMITPLRYNNPLPSPTTQHRSYFPPVVTEFQEYIPSKLIKLAEEDDEEEDSGSEPNSASREGKRDWQQSTLCKVLVLPRMMVSNIESYADHTSSRHRPHKQPCLHEKDVCFIMIQLVSALKYLQSKGVEEMSADLDGFLLFRTVSSRYPQLVLCCESFSSDHTPSSSTNADKIDDKEKGIGSRRLRITLCQGALAALCQLLHTEIPTEELIRERHVPTFARLTSFSEGFQKTADILQAEKPHSLTQARSLFEYLFWVDSEYQNGADKLFDSEQQARWWLDRERAKFICYAMKALLYFPVDGVAEKENSHNSINSSVSKLDIVDEYRAQFLLHATAKSLVDAALALGSEHVGEILL